MYELLIYTVTYYAPVALRSAYFEVGIPIVIGKTGVFSMLRLKSNNLGVSRPMTNEGSGEEISSVAITSPIRA